MYIYIYIFFSLLFFLKKFCVCGVCIFVLSLSGGCLQKRQVMVNSFGCCSDGRGAPQSPNCWISCRVRGKMGEGAMEDGRGMVIDVEGVWILNEMGMLSCIRAGIGVSVCVLVLVVVVVLAVVLV